MFRISPARCAVATATLVAIAAGAPAGAQAASDAAIAAGVQSGADWVEEQQDPASGAFNAGFSSFDPTPTALAPSGLHAADVANGGPSLQDATFAALSDPSNPGHPASVGGFENAILSAHAAGIDPSRVAATESLAANLAGTYSSGSFGDPAIFNSVAFGTLALNRVKPPRFLVDRSIAVIRQNQHDDGGWDFGQSTTPDTQDDPSGVDLTGATIAALCESGVPASDPAVEDAVDFLKSTLDPTTGALVSPGPFGSANANSNGWGVSGLNACGIDPQGTGFDSGQTPLDYLLSLQDNAGGADDGSFLYADPPPVFAPGPDLPSSRDALRALAGASFSADPPARATPALPRRRAVPAVPDGTSVPIALAVDDGTGGVTLCRVTVPSGASLAELLSTAEASSAPTDCATGAEFTGGELSKLNGQTGSWEFSVDRGTEQTAAGQTVRFGDFVGLRRTGGGPSVPGGGTGGGGGTVGGGDSGTAGGGNGVAAGGGGATAPPGPVPAVAQTTTAAAVTSKSLKISARKRVITVSLRCAQANQLCEGAVSLVYRKRRLARRAFLIAGGKTTKLKVKLSKAAMKRLGKSRKKVKANVFSRDGYGIASNSTRTVTLTPTK